MSAANLTKNALTTHTQAARAQAAARPIPQAQHASQVQQSSQPQQPSPPLTDANTHDALTLDDLRVGQAALVRDVSEPGEAGERLLEMGLTPGTHIELVRRGLFGEPLQLRVRGYMLSLRKRQAQAIGIQRAKS